MPDINTTNKNTDTLQESEVKQDFSTQENNISDNVEHIKETVSDNASKTFSDTMEMAGDTVKAINEVVNSASETVKAATSIINSVTDTNKDIPEIVDDATKNIQKTIDAASETVKAVSEAVKAIDDTVKVAEDAFTNIYSSIEEPLNETIGKISEKITDSLPENPQDMLKSPLIKGALISLSVSFIAWGIYSIFKPKQAV